MYNITRTFEIPSYDLIYMGEKIITFKVIMFYRKKNIVNIVEFRSYLGLKIYFSIFRIIKG